MADYAYHFFDLATRRFLDTLPLEGVAFGWEVGGIGQFTGEIPMGADGLDAGRVRSVVRPYRTKLFVSRDQSLVWGGWLHEEPAYDSSTARLTVTAEETLGAFESRTVPSLTIIGQDQLSIARLLISTAQADDGGNMGITLGSELSGISRDRTYLVTDETTVLTALTELSEVEGGFEFTTSVSWGVDGLPVERLVLGYPRLGRSRQAAGLVFSYNAFDAQPGNVASYQRPAGAGFATLARASTETEEGVPLVATATATALISQGYPRLEATESYDGITNMTTLQAHANAQLVASSGPRSAWTFTVKAGEGSELGDWQMGDDILIRITDFLFPPGADGQPGYVGFQRATACEVTPGVEGEETYTFTMSERIDAL